MEESTGTCPVRAIREREGTTRRAWAQRLGVDYGTVASHELGLPKGMQPALRDALQGAGYDAEEIARQYGNWRANMKR